MQYLYKLEEPTLQEIPSILLPWSSQKAILTILVFLQKEKKRCGVDFEVISHTLLFVQFDELQLLNKWKSMCWADLKTMFCVHFSS